MNYYNEWDKGAAAWLRELIKAGHLPQGYVDERSITEVTPADLAGFTQCHFFAGIGGWSYALQLAGIHPTTRLWTGSPPCQPFSVAGKQLGQLDERHLAPAFMRLVDQCRPPILFGEQVAAAIGKHWLDDLFTELERQGYACGAAVLPACSVGAPHKRDRLFFGAVANSYDDRQQPGGRTGRSSEAPGTRDNNGRSGTAVKLANPDSQQRDRSRNVGQGRRDEPANGGSGSHMAHPDDTRPQGRQRVPERAAEFVAGPGSVAGGMAQPNSEQQRQIAEPGQGAEHVSGGWHEGTTAAAGLRVHSDVADSGNRAGQPGESRAVERGLPQSAGEDAAFRPGPHNGGWSDADWLGCRDGKFRPVRSSTQQMADGSTAGMGRVCDNCLRYAEQDVEAWAEKHKRNGTEAVRELWDLLSQEEVNERTDGRYDSVREAPFLLAFLRQLTDQGWGFPVGVERTGAQAAKTVLRVLRFHEDPCYSSRGRGLDEQSSGELTDSLRLLSQILAYHTEICWGKTRWKNAEGFPLVEGAPARVMRLRGYGNAIIPQVAAEFIKAFNGAITNAGN